MPKKSALLIFSAILTFFIFLLLRCNNYYRKLTGPDARVTVAHVYKKDTGSKGSIYYYYIYKVDDNYYSGHSSGTNVKDLHTFIPQYFLVVYYPHYPIIHTLLWDYRFDSIVPLGAHLDTLHFDRSLIKKQIFGWRGLAPSADFNDSKAIKDYENRTGKKLFTAQNY